MDKFFHAFWVGGTNKKPQATVSPKALYFYSFMMIWRREKSAFGLAGDFHSFQRF